MRRAAWILSLAAAAAAGCTQRSAPTPPPASATAPAASPPAPAVDPGVARFQACTSDADCVAVPRVGCCHNGWQEAVAASQRDAYAASFTCPEAHPICAMVIVRDTRRPACQKGLCVMIAQ